MEERIAEFERFLASPAGLTFLARRVRAAARAVVREDDRLDTWLKARAIFASTAHTESRNET